MKADVAQLILRLLDSLVKIRKIDRCEANQLEKLLFQLVEVKQ